MSLFKSKCSKSKLLNSKKIAEHSKVFCFKFTDISRQERHAGTANQTGGGPIGPPGFKSLISREPKVGLTSNQAVNLSLSVV